MRDEKSAPAATEAESRTEGSNNSTILNGFIHRQQEPGKLTQKFADVVPWLSEKKARSLVKEAKSALGYGAKVNDLEQLEILKIIIGDNNEQTNNTTADSTGVEPAEAGADTRGVEPSNEAQAEEHSAQEEKRDGGTGLGVAVPVPVENGRWVRAGKDFGIQLSVGATALSQVVEDLNITWSGLKEKLKRPAIGEKMGEYFTRGQCVNGSRSDDSMTQADLIILDCDKGFSIDAETGEMVTGFAPEMYEAMDVLKASTIESCGYTSHSHMGPEKGPRYRIVAPPDRPLQNREELTACVNYLFEMIIDAGVNLIQSGESSNWSQPWFFPRVPAEREDSFRFIEHPGEPLSVQAALDWWAAQPASQEIKQAPASAPAVIDTSTVIGWFNSTRPIPHLLAHYGYEYVSQSSVNGEVIYRYLSPDSTTDSAGIIHFSASNRVFSHGSSDPLWNEARQAHDAFSVETVLNEVWAGDQNKLLAALKPEYDDFKAEHQKSELLNLKEGYFSEIPEEYLKQVQDAVSLSEVQYQGQRKAIAKELPYGVGFLDSFRKGYYDLEDQCQAVGEPAAAEQASIATAVIKAITAQVKVFHDDEERGYAHVPKENHWELYEMDSRRFEKYVRRIAHKELSITLDAANLKTIIQTLVSLAEFDGKCRDVTMRVAKKDGKYYLDLCNERWQVIEIDEAGYRVLDVSPVNFVRTDNMKPLPDITGVTPNLEKIWEFIHIIDKTDRLFYLAYILECYRSDTQYPVLEVTGDAGATKTTTLKMIKRLVDPNKLETRAKCRDASDLEIAASNGHLIAFENLSTLGNTMSDVLCRIATGSGNGTRTLHTTKEETIMTYKRPVCMEGINYLMVNHDLIDRGIHIEMPVLIVHTAEAKYARMQAEALPEIFAGLLDLFSKSLSMVSQVTNVIDNRMADFAILGGAVYLVTGHDGDFSEDLADRQKEMRNKAVQGSPVITALINYMSKNAELVATPQQILETLIGSTIGQSRSKFPTSGAGMAAAITRHTKTLAELGIYIDTKHGHVESGNQYRIWRKKGKEVQEVQD